MDLSNLRTSLREDESSTLRRTRHLRSSEDELSAVFRSAATSLTTLYRQGVASNKASYEKGYAHALAHVLELWDKDRDWLKGYLQRRIEALEVEGEDEMAEDGLKDPPTPIPSTSASRIAPARDASRQQSNKRSRSGVSSSPQQQRSIREEDDSIASRRMMHRMPHQSSTSSPSAATRTSSGPSSLFPSTSSFNFSAPLAYPAKPAPIHDPTTNNNHNPRQPSSAKASSHSGGVIKTSNAATSRRRLQRLKGLRAGGRDRVVEIEPQSQRDEMVDETEAASAAGAIDEGDAWTDEEGADENNDDGRKARGAGKKSVVWAEKGAPVNATNGGEGMDLEDDRVLERLDRRKRRRSSRQILGSGEGMVDMDELAEIGTTATASGEGGDGMVGYHS